MRIELQFDASKHGPKVWQSVASDDFRPALTQVQIERASGQSVRMIAADGFAMAIAEYPVAQTTEGVTELPEFEPFLVPPHGFSVARNLPKKTFTTVVLDTEARTTEATVGNTGKFVETWPSWSAEKFASFPDWRKVAGTATGLLFSNKKRSQHIAINPGLLSHLISAVGVTNTTARLIPGNSPTSPVVVLGNDEYKAWGLIMPMYVSWAELPDYINVEQAAKEPVKELVSA